MPDRLYAIPASHPSLAVERAFALKGLPLRRADFPPGLHFAVLLARFGRPTAPAVRFADGERVSGSSAIFHALDRRRPDPPLYPGPEAETAERWGAEVLQPLARRLVWAALAARPGALPSYGEGARLAVPLPVPAQRAIAPGLARAMTRLRHADPATVRADLRALGGHAERVERWAEDGTLGGAIANAADLQIGAALRLALTLDDVASALDGRPAAALARRWFPAYPGHVPTGALVP